MQNATDLAKHPYKPEQEKEEEGFKGPIIPYVAQMTTTYLQSNQTDFHILPSCNATKCVAQGTFINDDGLTLDLSQRNTYTFSYEHDVATPPTSMTVTVKTAGLKAMINANDLLNKIEIHDATAFGINAAPGATYEVAVTYSNSTTQALGDAAWAEKGDKLEILAPNHFDAKAVPVNLFDVDTIVFTKKPAKSAK
jgi:hypothetical protein